MTWPRIAPVAFDDTSRLIPGEYAAQPEHALSDLADDEAGRDNLIRLAGATNARLQAQEELHPAGLSRADMVFGVPYSTIINASFAYTGQGGRFHATSSLRGAWYCALDVATAIAEVAFHRVRMLAEIGRDAENDIPYRQFVADIRGQDFAWLDDGSRRTRACLDPDSYAAGQQLGTWLDDGSRRTRACLDPDSYAAGQQLGTWLRERDMGGVVYPAVRYAGGTNLAVLQPSLVGNVRYGKLIRISIKDGRLVGSA
ncbi:MAG: RES family NAD+ phosphorylase [Candidatus Nanopelagicales bacterium]|nr:RES family NAD+ phosphorylase [Candidatus Nanopelagicales bacterium]